jgi:hypothetical protein
MDDELMPEPDADLAERTLRFLDQDGASAMLAHRVALSLPAALTPDECGATADLLDRELPPDQAMLAIFAVPDEILQECLHGEMAALGNTLSGSPADPPLHDLTTLVEARLNQLRSAR